MREVHHPRQVIFRADNLLVGALHERANIAGVTVSQFLRAAVSDRVTTSERNDREIADA